MTDYDFTFKYKMIEADSEDEAYEKIQKEFDRCPEDFEPSQDNYDWDIEEHKNGDETFWCTIAISKDGVQLCKDNKRWFEDVPDYKIRNGPLLEMVKAKTVVFKMLMTSWHINTCMRMTYGQGPQGKVEAMQWVHSIMYSWFATKRYQTVVMLAPERLREEQMKLFDKYCLAHEKKNTKSKRTKGLMTKEVIAELR